MLFLLYNEQNKPSFPTLTVRLRFNCCAIKYSHPVSCSALIFRRKFAILNKFLDDRICCDIGFQTSCYSFTSLYV